MHKYLRKHCRGNICAQTSKETLQGQYLGRISCVQIFKKNIVGMIFGADVSSANIQENIARVIFGAALSCANMGSRKQACPRHTCLSPLTPGLPNYTLACPIHTHQLVSQTALIKTLGVKVLTRCEGPRVCRISIFVSQENARTVFLQGIVF